MMARMKELEEENRQLKRMYAEERMKAEIVPRPLQKSGEAIPETRDGQATNGSVQHASEVGLSGV